MINVSLFSNIRFYILVFSSVLAGFIYLQLNSNPALLTQVYALTSVTFLYFTLLASPLTRTFAFLPYRGSYLKARRALGVSASLFALLHGYFAFFKVIGGFEGLGNLPQSYLFGVSLGSISLTILFLLTATASDYAVSKLTYPRWKMLHRLVYLVAFFVAFHAILVGSHFKNLSGIIPKIFFIAGGLLLVLEAVRFGKYLKSKTLRKKL